MNIEKKGALIEAPISISAKGIGYINYEVAKEDGNVEEKSFEIQPERLNKAFPGDMVEVRSLDYKVYSKDQAEVVRVISRARMEFVGTIGHATTKAGENITFLNPDDKRMYTDILVLDGEKIPEGTKVLVMVLDWPEGAKAPRAKVEEIIGAKGENNTEMQSIVLEKGFRIAFPPEVEKEAIDLKNSYKKHFEDQLKVRRDMRNVDTMTIDPADAKDFDDAISFVDLGGDMYEIGVHIADVSYFVTPDSELDRESAKRGVSVYLVDRTIPMLPEVLSNDLCSLNPHEDKYTFSAVFKIDGKGQVHDKWFGRTIIHSNRRFTYEDAQAVIDGKEDGPYQVELRKLNEIAKIFERQKFLNGAINFETEEVKFELDATGKPIRVYRKQRLETHKLVEEYMLLANQAVAEYIFKSQTLPAQKKGAESVYRIHDVPNPEKIENLSTFITALGYNLHNKNGVVTSKDLNDLLKQVEGKSNEELIKVATIRSMAKAVYSTKNIGHFGLAFKFYTHFTSPIRRYPDLLVHRLLEREIKDGKIEQDEYTKYERICLQSSDNEKRAADAERASVKYKQVEFMSDKIGQVFDGAITGVTEWGIYIEDIETKCEGMVKSRDIGGIYADFYSLNEKGYTLKGEKTGRTFTLGDTVKFKVVAADLEKRMLDYALV